MHIQHIEFWPVKMKLATPYVISYEEISHTTNIFLVVETNTGVIGWGCAAPDQKVTGETPEKILRDLDTIVKPILQNADPTRMAWILHQIKIALPKSPSLLAAVDMALYDILGKLAHLPLYKLLGGFRNNIKTSITIGILPIKETVEKAREFVSKGFCCLKVKGGKDVQVDIEKMNKIFEAVGKGIDLRFDANQGYTVEECIHFIKLTEAIKIELIEQPTPKGKPELLGKVTNKVDVPVMADESIMNLRDAFYLAENNLVDMVNIKLMKVGGIFESIKIDAVAQVASFEVMVGCMDEAALGIAAGMHFALARRNVRYADLDGHLDLLEDPSSGVIIRDGVLYPQEKPGLGCEIRRT